MKHKIRELYIPSPGYSLIACDLSQAETWVVAYLAREGKMKEALLNSDIHTLTASAIFAPSSNCPHYSWIKLDSGNRQCPDCLTQITEIERYLGKKSNHGNSYRMSPVRWAQVINAESDEPPYVTVELSEAKRYHAAWLSFYPGIQVWWKDIENELGKSKTLTTPYKRKRNFGGFWGQELFKEATAFVPQSTVADHALGLVQPELGIPGGITGIAKHPVIKRYARIVHTAHDSVMLEVPRNRESEFAPIIYNLFRRPLVVNGEQFTIPVDVDWGDRWGKLEKVPKDWLN